MTPPPLSGGPSSTADVLASADQHRGQRDGRASISPGHGHSVADCADQRVRSGRDNLAIDKARSNAKDDVSGPQAIATSKVDAVLVGTGIMSATLSALLRWV